MRTLLTALALLPSAAVLLLWVRGGRGGDSVSAVLRGDRFTLVSRAGAIRLLAPPPAAADAGVRRAAGELVASLHDDQIGWLGCWLSHDRDGWLDVRDGPDPLSDTPADRTETQFDVWNIVRPL